MNRQLVVEPEAEADILDGYLWYEEQLSGLGSRFIEELDATFDSILLNPRSYPEVIPGIRRSLTRIFPYLAFYTLNDETIHILALIHAAQEPKYITERIGA